MRFDHYLPLVFFVAFAVYFIFRIKKYGGIRASFYGAKIRKTLGEVPLAKRGALKTTVRVHELEGDPAVGLEVSQSTLGGFSVRFFHFSRMEAAEVAKLLEEAARD